MSTDSAASASGEHGADRLEVEHSASRERYIASVDGKSVGYVDYMPESERVVITHTVIHEQYSGRGYAGQLVKFVLDDVRASGKRVVPVCSYVVTYIERHPEYQDLVDAN